MQELAKILQIEEKDFEAKIRDLGFVVKPDQKLSAKIIDIVAEEFGFKAEFPIVVEQEKPKTLLKISEEASAKEFAELTKIDSIKILDKIKDFGLNIISDHKLNPQIIELLADEFAFKVEFIKTEKPILKINDEVTVNEFAKMLNVNVNKILKKNKELGIVVTPEQKLNFKVIEILAKEFGVDVEFIKKTEAKPKDVKKVVEEESDDMEILEEILYNTLTDNFVNEETKKYLEKKYLKDKQEIKILQQHFINNGGLVTVFPFLQYAFFKLNLTDKNNRLKDETSKSNAANFIEFLKTGKLNNNSLKMNLNKLLCGIDIDDAIASEFIFSKDEEKKKEEEVVLKNIAEKIFLEIASRWPKFLNVLKDYDEYDEFKNISDEEIIRDYLFSRDAVINAYGTEENGETKILYYTMRISSKVYDDEIKNLPWACDEIFLPYMDYKLYVEYFGGMTYAEKD